METANYPASSIVRFEKHGGKIVGKYRQVSAPQKHWGFEVGEVVIRGNMKDKSFAGEVLLKVTKDFLARCPDAAVGWAPIELTLTEPGKLYGRWRQTHFRSETSCEVAYHSWQLYGLEKILTN
ncbi:MAG: hypothetical protein V4627_05170 [Pseudomonadota bacterium]